ncbi:hypothetical protein OF83DRAFT_524732 [Amylostereum chailletii]|nr:hypothetical protein OF83DRAFT_524732 [Amylostereum chailletii]
MLWRVARRSRQPFLPIFTPLSHLPRRPSLTCTRPVSLNLQRKGPDVEDNAVDHTITPAPPAPTALRMSNPTPDLQRPSLPPRPAEFPANSFPPPELLALIDSALIWTASKEVLFQHLQAIPTPRHLRPLFLDSRRLCRFARQMITTSRPGRAVRVLILARTLGCPHMNKELFETLTLHLSLARQWRWVLLLETMAHRQLGRSTVQLLNWHTRALIETRHYARLDRVLARFEEDGLLPSQRTFHLLISGHIRNHNLPLAMKALRAMQDAGFSILPSTQAVVVAAYQSLGPDTLVKSQALQILPFSDGKTQTFILNSVLKLCIDARDIEWMSLILQVFQLDHMDIHRTITSSGSPLSLDPDDEEHIRAVSSFHLLRSSLRVAPDIVTYTMLLNYAALEHDLSSSIGLLAHMQGASITPNSTLVAALIRVIFAADMPVAAVKIIEDICQNDAFAREVLDDLASELSANNDIVLPFIEVPPSVEIFNALASGLLPLLGLDGLRYVFQLMGACSITPDTHTLQILVSHLSNVEQTDPEIVILVLRDLMSLVSYPTTRHLEFVLQSILCRERRRAGRSAWVNRRSRTPAHATPTPPTRLVEVDDLVDSTAGLVLSPNVPHQHLLRPIIQILTAKGVRPDRSAMALRLHYEVSQAAMNIAKTVFQDMLDRGMYPTAYHYAALMDGYASAGDLDAAHAVLRSAIEAGVRPTTVMYTILIAGHARQEEPELAARTFQNMLDAGVKPDIPAVDAAVSAYVAVGQYKTAKEVLLALWSSVAPPRDSQEGSLKTLIGELRALRPSKQGTSKLSRNERRMFKRKLQTVVDAWKRAATAPVRREKKELGERAVHSCTQGQRPKI